MWDTFDSWVAFTSLLSSCNYSSASQGCEDLPWNSHSNKSMAIPQLFPLRYKTSKDCMDLCEYVHVCLSEVNWVLYSHILMLSFGSENIHCTEEIITFFQGHKIFPLPSSLFSLNLFWNAMFYSNKRRFYRTLGCHMYSFMCRSKRSLLLIDF